jgi:hypothetical protein
MTLTPESAVQRCFDLYDQACDLEDARKDFSPESLARVRRVYRQAMPFLTPDTIDAFLACVTHGLVLQIFDPAEASKLLYAVQIAVGSRRATQAQAKSDSKSQTKSPCAPSMATVSSSPRVGDHQPQPAESKTPPPPSSPVNGREAELPAAPAPSPLGTGDGMRDTPAPNQRRISTEGAALAPQHTTPTPLPKPRNQVEDLLEQLLAGKLPAESPLTPCAAVLKAAPPTPSPRSMVPQAQSAAPQVPAS